MLFQDARESYSLITGRSTVTSRKACAVLPQETHSNRRAEQLHRFLSSHWSASAYFELFFLKIYFSGVLLLFGEVGASFPGPIARRTI